ncbi:cytochrome P450 [Agrocybe pediades]|nr:cytochrome P450 [Agrocybe pediades]
MASLLFNEVNITLSLISLALSLWLYHREKVKGLRPPYPPGPKGLPLLGNLLDIPAGAECEAYDKWCKELGSDIIYLRAGGNGMVVLNSLEAVDDLLVKRSATFSSRPRMPMPIELMGCEWSFSLLPYGRAWRDRRRLFIQYFHPSHVKNYHTSETKFAQSMLPRLLDNPEDFWSTLQYAVSGIALSVTYGIPIQREGDPYIALAEETIRNLGDAALPTNFWVNLVPSLKYIPEFVPGAGFKKKAREWKAGTDAFLTKPFLASIQAIESGTARPSFVSSALGDTLPQLSGGQGPTPREKLIIDVAATAYGGASETTLAVLRSFFVAMLCFPEVQKKGQKELDRVVRGRLPGFQDESSLPYIGAIVKEAIRWACVTPVGLPHTSNEDHIYRGYFIPKDSIIIPNMWALLRDEKRYGHGTSAFRPERFLKDGKLDPDVVDPQTIAFGYGRRECPGKHIALSHLFISIATVLATFDISEALDENGSPIPPKVEWHSGVVREPTPFKCTIQPRSNEVVKMIRGLDVETSVYNEGT